MTATKFLSWFGTSSPASPARREKRTPISFPVAVSGYRKAGDFFAEDTFTVNLSQHGCCFYLGSRLELGTVVGVRLGGFECSPLAERTDVLYQIAWIRRDRECWVAGASRL